MESHRLDMLLVLDARQALSERGQLALSMADARFRLWGFLKTGADVSPAQVDRLCATFGFEQTYIPQHGHTERPVQVAWVPLTSAIPEQRGASAVQWKRRHVWSPGPRNRLIARLAAAIVQGDHQYLKERAPRLASCAGQFQFERTVVLAESPQQAVAIARRLPGWPIVAGEHDSDGLDPRDAARWRVRRALLPPDRPAVFTPDGLNRLDGDWADVIIWSGAGPVTPLLRTGKLIRRCDQARPLLLVDFGDRSGPTARRWTRRRREAYTAVRWTDLGRNPLTQPVGQFLERGIR